MVEMKKREENQRGKIREKEIEEGKGRKREEGNCNLKKELGGKEERKTEAKKIKRRKEYGTEM